MPTVQPRLRIRFRIGINVGDVIVDGDDIYGDGVNVAARIESLAEPGGIYISRSAADQVRDKVPIGIESRGTQTLKNIARPIEIFCLISGEPPRRSTTETPSTDKTSIAVLAFTNMSGDAEQEYFSDGISEDIITDLAKLSGPARHRPQLLLHLQGKRGFASRRSRPRSGSATCSKAACARPATGCA